MFNAQNTTPPVDERFIITIRATAGMTFYYPSSGLNNTPISWGDGQSGVYSGGVQTHTYVNAGDYQIINSGVITDFNFWYISSVSASNIITVDNGGSLCDNITNCKIMFAYCVNLISVNATFENVVNGYQMFLGCSSLTSLPSATFNSLVENDNIFQNSLEITSLPSATFNSLTNINQMFSNLSKLNDLSSATFANVTNGYRAFYPSVTSLTALPSATFEKLETAEAMLYGCSSLTALPSATFKSLTSGLYMMYGTKINTVDYSNILIRTESANPPNNTIFWGGNAKYNNSAISARASLISRDNWNFTDGGLE